MPRKKSTTPSRPAPDLPRVPVAAIDALEAYLLEHYPIKRPPIVAAHLLGLICELDKSGAPFPMRSQVAEAIGCSVFGIDAALSVALSRGLISIDMTISQGNVLQRDSAIRHRHYRPTREIAAVFNRAVRKVAA